VPAGRSPPRRPAEHGREPLVMEALGGAGARSRVERPLAETGDISRAGPAYAVRSRTEGDMPRQGAFGGGVSCVVKFRALPIR
jgi:hypothetical protein